MPFRLMLVTDSTLLPPDRLIRAVGEAVSAGVDAVQLREKDLPEPELIGLGRRLRAVTRGRALLIVNGTAAQASACEADGVHLAEGVELVDLPPRPPSLKGRGRLTQASVERGLPLPFREGGRGGRSDPPSLLLGRSVHSLDAARRAEAEGVDYLVLGTIFPSRSHPGVRTGGTALVAEVSRAVQVPVIAIGGITAENAGGVIEAGASGVAVISAILAATEPRAAAAALVSAIERRRPSAVGERE